MAAYRRVHDMHVSLWAWWEVVAAHHRVHDHACCHLQADCLESGISSGPLCSTMCMGTFTLPLHSLGHELHILTVVPSTLHGMVKYVLALLDNS